MTMRRIGTMKNNPFRNEDEFIAALLRQYPHLRVEVLPNGKKIVLGIALKPPAKNSNDAPK
jgi:hypothetical protein